MKKVLSFIIVVSMLLTMALPAFSVSAKEENADICIIYSAETDKEGNVVSFDGQKALKWGPGFDELKSGGVGELKVTPQMHMEKYRFITIEMYSAQYTNNPFLYYFYGTDNPETPEVDYYCGSFCSNWEGSWKKIQIPISGGYSGRGDFSAAHDPDYALTETSKIEMTANPYTSSPFYSETEVYIRKIYFEGEALEKTDLNEKGEYILPNEYDPSTMTDYVSLVKAKHPDKHHPRIVVTDELLARINKYKDTDPYMKKVYGIVKDTADRQIEKTPTPAYYMNKTGTTHQFNRTVEDVAKHCGMMYLLTGDTKYADCIWAEVENMLLSDKPWWDTSTGLDSAHIANAMGLCYDWCYDYLNDDQRLMIRNGIMKYALAYGQKIRNGAGYMGFRNNVVAANSKGYMTAVLAICDEEGYADVCNQFINNVIDYIPLNLFFQFVPDGNYAEGSSYWTYTMTCLAFMFNAMDTAMGTNGGLTEYAGLKETNLWGFGMRGPMGDFNHSDSTIDALQIGNSSYHYYSELYDLPQLRSYRMENYDKYEGLDIEDLFWYNPEAPSQLSWRDGLQKDFFYGGLEPTLTFRSSYDPDAFFIAAKGGNRKTGHDQSDAGTFIFDALGVRWLEETGAGVYNTDLPERYYYRDRAEGHNVLYFNPEEGGGTFGGQTAAVNNQDTLCPIVSSGASDYAAFGVLDLWPSYKDDTVEYKRGIGLISGRTQFVIRDEFKAKKPSEFYSYFHTNKSNEITINPDGKSLTMKTKNGVVCQVDFVTDIKDFELGVMEAVPHPASPVPGPDNVPDRPADTQQKFYLHANSAESGYITVVFTPMPSDGEAVLPEILPLSDWSKYLENKAPLTGISVDGIPLENFNQGLGTYYFETDKLGEVTATADEGIEISVTQANNMGDAAIINATNKATGDKLTYKIVFVQQVVPGMSEGAPFEAIDPHHIPEPQNGPEKMHDGEMATRFAIDGYDGEAYFTVDLGSSRLLNGYSISFYNGQKRKNKYKVEISDDSENWSTVFEGFSPGNSDQLIGYDFEPTWARYVRFTGYGAYTGDETTQSSKWNSITEFVVHEEIVDFDDTKEHWAQPDIFFGRTYNLVKGMGGNEYAPENSVTRAEFITMMVRACKFKGAGYKDGTFKDVKAEDWYADVLQIANDKGIIPSEMIENGAIKPNEKLTREEMCAIATLAYTNAVYREVSALGVTGMFTDLSDGPYLTYIDKAIGLRLVNGMSADTFAPKNDITRAQAATILKRLYLKIYNVNN